MGAEIDCLTGETQILSCEVVHDGFPLNPAVDVGQVEGSLMFGLGFSLFGEVNRSPHDNRMINAGTWDYKVPTGLDIPINLNVHFVGLDPKTDAGKPGPAVFKSKATGEPATMLGGCAYFAVKEAIYAARKELGVTGYFRMDFPASPEKILLACENALPVPAHDGC